MQILGLHALYATYGLGPSSSSLPLPPPQTARNVAGVLQPPEAARQTMAQPQLAAGAAAAATTTVHAPYLGLDLRLVEPLVGAHMPMCSSAVLVT